MAKPVQITLNPSGVIAPALNALRKTIEVVSLCLAALEKGDLSVPPPICGVGMQLSFASETRDVDERQNIYKQWVLTRGFHELARGLRLSLEEAYLYVGVAKLHGTTTWGRLQEQIAGLKTEANIATFPALVGKVNEALTEKLNFENEFRSLNSVRNCLEHRNGVVGIRDMNKAEKMLVLSLPRFKLYYVKDGAEIELVRGHVVEKDTEILMKRITGETSYKLGSRISFTPDEFQAIGMACWLFAQDLASKLPRLQSVAA